MTSFWDVLLSPVAVNKFTHTVTSSFVLAALFVCAVCAWYLLRGREQKMARKSIAVASVFGLVFALITAFTGDRSGAIVARVQPMKLAALEALYDGEEGAALTAVGILRPEAERSNNEDAFYFKIAIPKMLSLMSFRDADAFVPGINDLVNGNPRYGIMPTIEKIERGRVAIAELASVSNRRSTKQATKRPSTRYGAKFDPDTPEGARLPERVFRLFRLRLPRLARANTYPNVPLLFYSFRLMVGAGCLFILVAGCRLVVQPQGHARHASAGCCWVLLLCMPLAYLASQAGWIVAEVGRQPWAIQDLMPVGVAASRIASGSVATTFFIFLVLFAALLVAEISILCKQIKIGPEKRVKIMDTLALLQHYWWFLISLLGALLVFLLFVQGGQSLLYTIGRTEHERNLIVNSLGRKWELTFTTLVTFGGAFFASFPLFYSHQFRRGVLRLDADSAGLRHYKPFRTNTGENPITYPRRKELSTAFLNDQRISRNDSCLGAAVGTLFHGCEFHRRSVQSWPTCGGATPRSRSGPTPWHGLEAVARLPQLWRWDWPCCSSRGCWRLHYFMNDIDDTQIRERSRRRSLCTAGTFLVFFLVFLVSLLFAQGWSVDPATGIIAPEPYKYLHNLLAMPYVGIGLLAGVALVLWSIWLGWRGSRKAIWLSGSGTVLTVLALLLTAGWNDTSYYPSLADMQSSLTIYNSSSSEFTLKAMSIVSLCIPFVVAYIGYAWWALSRKPQDGSKEELKY